MEDEEGFDPVSTALQTRRIPHSSSRKKSRGGGQTLFDPLRTLGLYDLECGTTDGVRQNGASLEIHSLTPKEDGLIGSLEIPGLINGMFVLAGSRKVLNGILEEMEENESDPDEAESTYVEDGDDEERSALEAEDEKINRRAQTFEKNSFRNPKFWMHWKGRVQEKDEGKTVSESNQAYVVYSGNDCKDFKGTITCKTLGWKNVSFKGQKITSKARPCPVEWTDFDDAS